MQNRQAHHWTTPRGGSADRSMAVATDAAVAAAPTARCEGSRSRVANSSAHAARARNSVRRFPCSGDCRIATRPGIRTVRTSGSSHRESETHTTAGTGALPHFFAARTEGGSGSWSPMSDRTAAWIAGRAARQSLAKVAATDINSTPSLRSGAGKPFSAKPPTCRSVSRMGEPGLSTRSWVSASARPWQALACREMGRHHRHESFEWKTKRDAMRITVSDEGYLITFPLALSSIFTESEGYRPADFDRLIEISGENGSTVEIDENTWLEDMPDLIPFLPRE